MLYLAPMTGLPPCPHCGQQHAEDVLLCPTAEKLMPLSGRVLDGKFRFVKQLGEGGMGAVWKAENVLVKKTVAIKLMHVQFSPLDAPPRFCDSPRNMPHREKGNNR